MRFIFKPSAKTNYTIIKKAICRTKFSYTIHRLH